MRAYSLDFRQKIIHVYETEPISQRKLAERFQVALSFIQKLIKQYRETGSIAPKVRTEQTPTKLNQEQLAVLESLVNQKNDATLAELQELLKAETGVQISISTVYQMLKKLNLTRKKKHYTPQKRIQKKDKLND